MSQQEQDAIIGRLIREKSEAGRRRAALDAELKLVEKTLTDLFKLINTYSEEQIKSQLEPIQKYFNQDTLIALLRERDEARAIVIERVKQLRELGAE